MIRDDRACLRDELTLDPIKPTDSCKYILNVQETPICLERRRIGKDITHHPVKAISKKLQISKKAESNLHSRVPSSNNLRLLYQVPEILHLLVRKFQQSRLSVLINPLGGPGSWNGEYIGSLSKQPCNSNLCSGTPMYMSHTLQPFHQLHDFREVLLRVLRHDVTEVTLREISGRLELSSQYSTPHGAIGHNRDTQLAACLQEVNLG